MATLYMLALSASVKHVNLVRSCVPYSAMSIYSVAVFVQDLIESRRSS